MSKKIDNNVHVTPEMLMQIIGSLYVENLMLKIKKEDEITSKPRDTK